LRLGERALAPLWELPALLLVVTYYLLAEDPQSYETMNVVGPMLLTGILFLSAMRSAFVNNANLWTCLFWFRLSTAIYFGIGSLVPFFMNDATRLYLEVFYPARPNEMFRVNLLVAGSALLTLAAARATLLLRRPPVAPTIGRDEALISVALIFAAVGYLAKFLVTIPLLLGLLDGAVVWGTLLTLGSFGPIGIYLITRHAILGNRAWLVLSVILVLADISVGVMLFNKSEAMYGGLFFVLGVLSAGVTVAKAIFGVAVVWVLFGLVVPITDYGRVEAPRLYGENGGTVSQRVELLARYFDQSPTFAVNEEIQNSYVRLSYIHAASFAMHRFDIGLPGHSLMNAWAAPIPRFLWPDKPNMTEIGQDFNELALNFRMSGSAPGIFADAYWNFGWWGVPIVFLPLGIVFALMSRYALWVQSQMRWLLFPVVLMMVRMGFRVDGFLVTDIWGPLFIAIAFHYVLVAGESIWTGRGRGRGPA